MSVNAAKTKDPFANLIITRKRKLYKFAHFNNFSNCFTYSHNQPKFLVDKKVNNFFNNKNPKILEVAAGTAQFSLELARRHKNVNYVAADIKSDRLYTSAKQALEEDIRNIAFVRINMQELGRAFRANSFKTIWITFPDPYPRKRSIRRRLTHPHFLEQYKNLLTETGYLNFKTDSKVLFDWSLDQFNDQNWQIIEKTYDLHDSNLSEDYKIMTHYEQKFVNQKIPINFVKLQLI